MTEVKQCPICNSENYFSILNTTKTYWPDIDLVDKLEEQKVEDAGFIEIKEKTRKDKVSRQIHCIEKCRDDNEFIFDLNK